MSLLHPVRFACAIALCSVCAIAPPASAQTAGSPWPTLAGDSARSGVGASPLGPIDLTSPLWIRTTDHLDRAIEPYFASGVVSDGARAFAVVLIDSDDHLLAIDLQTGAALWSAPLPLAFFDSWATPAVDMANGTVIVAGDSFLTALDGPTGSLVWQTDLQADLVNASPLVTTHRPGANRALITTYRPFGIGELVAVNVDPFDAGANPYSPGEVVWRVPVGPLSGATPALDGDTVYIATSGVPGTVVAIDLDDPSQPLWTVQNPAPAGFFGGLLVADGPDGSRVVYGASYNFFGGRESANLVSVDAQSGALRWSVACNRSASIPIALGGGRIALSTGIVGFGSQPGVQVFTDHGAHATLDWDSACSTWNTSPGAPPPCAPEAGSFTILGGWNHQPVVVMTGSGARMYAGAIPADAFEAVYARMVEVLLDGPEPVVGASFDGAGTTPALAGGLLVTLGPGGLYAFAPVDARYDINGDGRIDIEDLYVWHGSPVDVDGDGVVDSEDARALEARLRQNEIDDMSEGRR